MLLSKMKKVNAKGFSLVELMIVVAIIGILSAIAVPNFQRFQRKARTSEAKNNLAAYYTASKAAIAEYGASPGNFVGIGFAPEGTVNYRIFAANQAVVGMTGPNHAACINTSIACLANGVAYNTWVEMPVGSAAARGVGAGPVAGVATAGANFTAGASGWVGAATVDTWTMNQAKTLANTSSGI